MKKTYDAILIFLTSLSEEDIDSTMERVRGEIAKLGGDVERVAAMGRRMFARPMNKQDAGYYYKMRFELAPDAVGPLQNRLKLVDALFRMQVTVVDARLEARTAAQAAAAAAAASEEESGEDN